jgi:hypothetical protein
MILETPSVTQLAQVIAQVAAPSFLLGAVASYIALLMARMNRIIDRAQALNAIGEDEPGRAHLKTDIPRLKRRAVLLNKAILLSTISAITTSLLVIVAFISAYLNVKHEYGVALLFIFSLGFFTASLVNLARDTRVALTELDHYR